MKPQELINFAYSEFEPYINISDELAIRLISDDAGRHLEFTVENRTASSFLRDEVPHTYHGYRTVIRYKIEKIKEE